MYAEVTSVYVPVKTPDYPVWAIVLSAIAMRWWLGYCFSFIITPRQRPWKRR